MRGRAWRTPCCSITASKCCLPLKVLTLERAKSQGTLLPSRGQADSCLLSASSRSKSLNKKSLYQKKKGGKWSLTSLEFYWRSFFETFLMLEQMTFHTFQNAQTVHNVKNIIMIVIMVQMNLLNCSRTKNKDASISWLEKASKRVSLLWKSSQSFLPEYQK